MPSPVNRDFPIYRHRHESIGFRVLELNNLMSISRQLPPTAGFLGILLMAW